MYSNRRDTAGAGPAGLVIVLPVTTKAEGVRSHVAVQPPEGGLRKASFVKCEDVRSVAVERLGKRLGAVSPPAMEAVALRLRILMDL
jgi:mRNA interferase MazF